MSDPLGKILANKAATAVITVASVLVVAGGGIYFWKHPEQLAGLGRTVKWLVAWTALLAVLPWSTFFVTRWVLAKDSNAASAGLLIGYGLLDLLLTWLLMGRFVWTESVTRIVVAAILLAALFYNYVVCEFIATRLEDEL